MSFQNINSVISIIPVSDFKTSFAWYKKLFGRDPDVVPMEDIAEWQLVENAWVQVSLDPDGAGSTTIVIGVDDLETQWKSCSKADLSFSEIVEYPEIIKMADILDPDGNRISLVQDISGN